MKRRLEVTSLIFFFLFFLIVSTNKQKPEKEKVISTPSLSESTEPNCKELLVKEGTGFFDIETDVGLFPSGDNVVLLWPEYHPNDHSQSIYGKIFDTEGKTVLDEFQVAKESEHAPYQPNLGILNETHFVSIFITETYTNTYNSKLYGQIMKIKENNDQREFELVGNKFLISEDNVQNSDVSVFNETHFVIVWSTNYYNDNYEVFQRIYGQLIKINYRGDDNVIEKIGSIQQINSESTWKEKNPKVAKLSQNGERFVVVWVSSDQDYYENRIVGQIFETVASNNKSFERLGDEFQINDYKSVNHYSLELCTFSDFKYFVVVWDSFDYINDESRYDIFGKTYNSTNGKEIHSPFTINHNDGHYENRPDVAPLSDNQFVVIWSSHNTSENIYSIIGQVCNLDTEKNVIQKNDDQFIVNSFSKEDLFHPKISKSYPYQNTLAVTWVSMISYYVEELGTGSDEYSDHGLPGYDLHAKIYRGKIENTILINKKIDSILVKKSSEADITFDNDLFIDSYNSEIKYSVYLVDTENSITPEVSWLNFQEDKRIIHINNKNTTYEEAKTTFYIRIIASTECHQKSLYVRLQFEINNTPIINAAIVSIVFVVTLSVMYFFFYKKKFIQESQIQEQYEDRKLSIDLNSSDYSLGKDDKKEKESEKESNKEKEKEKDEINEIEGIKLEEMKDDELGKENNKIKNDMESFKDDNIEKKRLIGKNKQTNIQLLKNIPIWVLTLFIIMQLYAWFFNTIYYGLILRDNITQTAWKVCILIIVIIQIIIFQIFCLRLILKQIKKKNRFPTIKISAPLWIVCFVLCFIVLIQDVEDYALSYTILMLSLSVVYMIFLIYYFLNTSKFCNCATKTTRTRVITNIFATLAILIIILISMAFIMAAVLLRGYD
ncbi:major facilitator superfamily domain-containing protein [Anaeramoeba flamelloides]|uniref:Major facilitator superfamily domain-containing protein n=1 Tax=Anaeramoeba flamelloides TaxID=1746091 RepID=A0AAV7YX14_9EUKA|nr:major facilitator superfamily domain-containing protein [Anaeramoeba flamelloides]